MGFLLQTPQAYAEGDSLTQCSFCHKQTRTKTL